MTDDLVLAAHEQVRSMVPLAVKAACAAGDLPGAEPPDFVVEVPADPANGDCSTNVALVGARVWKMAPPKIAQAIASHLDLTDSLFARAETAGPGFLNFYLKPEWFAEVVETIEGMGERYGRTGHGNKKKVMVEFVSANPTGPMHLGNARGGALGDCLASALDAAGYDVSREFYVNDAGNQIEKFAVSLEARYLQQFPGGDAVAFPEDGYHGDDITERAREFAQQNGDRFVNASEEARRTALVDFALPANIKRMQDDLARYRISYDTWFFESSLYRDGLVKELVDRLSARGLAYEKDGAIWYQATQFGAEKDEVLIRQNGNATYFAADIAYHYDKFARRGFETVIDVWGADHHGHVARLKGAMDAVGLSGDALEIVLMQLVRLMKDGEPYRMSKRSGKSVTLSDLLDEVPIDAARWFFNMNSPGSAMDFDLDLAVKESSDNPVYYVQYAHARICSIQRRLKEEGVQVRNCTRDELLLLGTPEEIALIRILARYPGEIVTVTTRLDPSVLTHYAMELATGFHRFYTACRVRGEDEPLMQARLCLCRCTGTVLRNLLGLMKIDAPQAM